jgi:P-type E1-E2 ATPase
VAVFGLDDPLRTEAKQTIANLKKLGVTRIAMISGDRHSTATSIANELGLDEVFAECKPEDKLRIVRAEMKKNQGTVIAVGDGINDAPALAAASVGVAMGARGATAASEAADVVIVEDSIEHLADAIDIAQGSRSRALQAAGVGMTLASGAMLLGAFGIFNATAAAVTQEFIDAAAILWALVPAKSRIRK